jgi:hypothetical protein
MANTIPRGLLGTRGYQDSYNSLNPQTPGHVWYMTITRNIPPAPGCRVTTFECHPQRGHCPFGDIQGIHQDGWGNANGPLKRRYAKNRIQIFYNLINTFEPAAVTDGHSQVALSYYLPGEVSQSHDRMKLLLYARYSRSQARRPLELDRGLPSERESFSATMPIASTPCSGARC